MYVVDYSKVKDRKAERFALLTAMNKVNECILFIDTKLGKADESLSDGDYFDLEREDDRSRIVHFLNDKGMEYKMRTRKRQEFTRLLGIPTSKARDVEDMLLAVFIPKGAMTMELFELTMCTHDLMIGIGPKRPTDEFLRGFSNNEWDQINQVEGFSDTLIDSHWLAYFYTSHDFSAYDTQ